MKVVRTNPKVFDRDAYMGSVRMKGSEVLWGENYYTEVSQYGYQRESRVARHQGDSIIGIGALVPMYRSCQAFSYKSENCREKTSSL